MEKAFFSHLPIQPITPKPSVNIQHQSSGKSSFSKHLDHALSSKGEELKVSRHANERLAQRGIKMESIPWDKVGRKVQEARQKGVNESLVLLKNAALIVSAKNKTVITAMNREEASSQIFTNINAAIVID